MAKIATDIEQSKKLAEILPVDSADMHYNVSGQLIVGKYEIGVSSAESAAKYFGKDPDKWAEKVIPAWSLSALLEIMPAQIKTKESAEPYSLMMFKRNLIEYSYELEYGYRQPITVGWLNAWYEIKSSEQLIDACADMIVILKEKNLL